jgi:hypothetical protein
MGDFRIGSPLSGDIVDEGEKSTKAVNHVVENHEPEIPP